MRDRRRLLSADLALRTSAGDLSQRFAGRRSAHISEDYVTVTGKRRAHRHRAEQMTLSFGRSTRRIAVQVQASDDGVAYRYALGGSSPARLVAERSAFVLPASSRAWMQPYVSNYEAFYIPLRLAGFPTGDYGFPALAQLAPHRWALLTESDMTGDYAGSRLTVRAGSPGRLALRQGPPDARARRTPWRVAILGDLATVVESDLVDDLAGASQIADPSWIRPGRVAWSWWSDWSSPRSLERQEQYVDFAAQMHFEYVLVDEGWDAAWVPSLVRYAADRGVGVLLWGRWSDLGDRARQRELLRRWHSWGVAGVKLDFMHSDRQARMRWYDDVARAAAAEHLLVDFHGSTIPRGLQRRWPNVMSFEAVRGAEHYLGRVPHAMPTSHNATLPFTRNAIGSMDYTPVTFSAVRDSSAAQELALSVVFESGLQHFADAPDAYLSRPIAAEFLSTVPTAWDDTRLLSGYPGHSVTIARRSGADWWIGAVNADVSGNQQVDLDFLAPGRRYEATVVTDAPGDQLAARRQTVTATDTLELPVAVEGGAAVRIVASR